MDRIHNSDSASVFTVEGIEPIPKGPIPAQGITVREIDSVDEIEMKKSTEPGKLSMQFKHHILQPLADIFNSSVKLNKVPEDRRKDNSTST